jgi:hypothetical protein
MTTPVYIGGAAGPAQGAPPYDPLRFCIFTTIALIAWVIGAPAAVTVMGGLGLWAYWRAWRAGLRETRCFLRDPRIAMAYLFVAVLLGAAFLARGIAAAVAGS